MVRQTYIGVGSRETAITEFEALEPLVGRLRQLQMKCRPFGTDYHALALAIDALNTTAYHFTRRPHFYGAKCDSAGPIRPPD
jgi:hypothetical protein